MGALNGRSDFPGQALQELLQQFGPALDRQAQGIVRELFDGYGHGFKVRQGGAKFKADRPNGSQSEGETRKETIPLGRADRAGEERGGMELST
jgi:hypothetical protein